MSRVHIILFSALGVAVVAPALAQDAPDTKPAKRAVNKQKMVCRTDRTTGSLVKVDRYCATQEQWDDHEVKSREELLRWDREAMERSTR